ncbi:bifunctional Tetratricopeptide-like helical domain superfamily/Tetratricopeptide repeat/RNA polymerase-associated protein Ctr9 [Babesia duncani]|uniref:Bifunctional Tetratricopeptide-like helical domain superfamily/Tetratricopeptide repeat/RNA polymerase-associated protein Ctr9 n=1 Tax=Babesia duncani TaxID=323732 RepID=A0AAD9UPJ7_9APIC|nr:bifunctional Tetratricopeptide-like helical domain superfamily/Tetratricopeptide repeat/RNA polymerase-associated protein Ctr9 [Babesia duncani]
MNSVISDGFGITLNARGRFNLFSSNKTRVWISQDDCTPSNLDKLKDLFKSENVALGYWISLAYIYRNVGNADAFESLLKEAEAHNGTNSAADAVSEIEGLLYSCLAVHEFRQSEQCCHDEKRHERHLDWANHYISKCEGFHQYGWCFAMGQYHLLLFFKTKAIEERNRAKDMFNIAMSLRPNSVIPFIYYANILVMEGHVSAAITFYLHALIIANYYNIVVEKHSSNPKFTENIEYDLLKGHLAYIRSLLLFGLGACKFISGDILEAKGLVEASLNIHEFSGALRLKGAIAAFFMVSDDGEFDKNNCLKTWFNSTIAAYRLDCRNIHSQLTICDLLFQKGQIDECEAYLSDIGAIESVTFQAIFFFIKGKCAHSRQEYVKALEFYQKAIGLRSDMNSVRLNLIKVALALENTGVAREHAEYLLLQPCSQDPNVQRTCGLLYLTLAKEAIDKGRFDLIGTESEGGLGLVDVSCLLFSVHQDVGHLIDERLFKALKLLGNATRAFPDDVYALEYHGKCLEMLIERGRGNFNPQLKQNYEALLAASTNHKLEWTNNYAVVCIKSHDYSKAINALEKLTANVDLDTTTNKALISDPRALVMMFNLAYAKEMNGNISRAQRIYSQISRNYPKYPAPWLRRSIIAFNKSDMESANRYLEQLKIMNRKSMEPWLLRAHMLISTGNYAEGINEINKMTRVINAASFDPYTNTLLSSAVIQRHVSNGNAGAPLPKEALKHAKMGLKRPALCNFYAANCIAVILAHERQLKPAYESFGILLETMTLSPHMKFVACKNMAIFCAATASRKNDASYDRMRMTRANHHFSMAMQHGKLDKSLYIAYGRYLFDARKYEEGLLLLENARLYFPHEVIFEYNQIILLDAMLCKFLRDPDKVASYVEMTRMLAAAKYVESMANYFKVACTRDSTFTSKHYISLSSVQSLANRARDTIIPHLNSALPQLEETFKERQRAKEKRLELQRTIQQAQEEKRLQEQQRQQQERQQEAELSQRLLQEASEIASELL